MSVVKRLEIQGWSSGWCYDVKKFELWVLYLMLLVAEAGHHSIVFSSSWIGSAEWLYKCQHCLSAGISCQKALTWKTVGGQIICAEPRVKLSDRN